MIHKLILITFAGGAGALARYGLTGLVYRMTNSSRPWGTFAVNALGCFIAGALWSIFESRWPVSSQTRTIVMIGFLGAFTTFSTYMVETGEMFRSAQWMGGALNIFMHNGIGLIALFAGAAIVKS